MTALPHGFGVRIRDDVRRLHGGRVLLGGSPLRVLRLSPRALGMLDGDTLTVRDAATDTLARRLLDANVGDPVLPGPIDAGLLTVVIPVQDRAGQLDRALTALHGLGVIVVDDGSDDPAAVARVAAAHGARLVALPDNRGPAGARNAGLAAVRTPYVGFVDSDVRVGADTLRRLARHLADPRVALVGPMVASEPDDGPARPRWFERFDAVSSSLALGRRACSVRPGAAVGWLPSACLVGRVTALGDGFGEDLRVGEDVDLVWRLIDAGHRVRYDPSERAAHDTRTTVREWLGRKFVYGTGAAPLARRHPGKGAVAILSPAMAAAALALLLRRRWSAPVAAVLTARSAYSLHRLLPPQVAGAVAIRGLGWALRQETALILRHWWPVTAALLPVSRTARRITLTALVVDAAITLAETRGVDPLTALAGHRLDDAAYGAGVWWGITRHRSLAAAQVRVIRAREA